MSAGYRPTQPPRALMSAALGDAACVGGGVLAYLATGNIAWLAAGLLLGAGLALPVIIRQSRSRSR